MLCIGGPSIAKECKAFLRDQQREKLTAAEVMSTTAGNLQCKRIIHAVGPRWRSKDADECKQALMYCITNCFDKLLEDQLQTIAIPPVSTGIFDFPIELAAPIMIDAIIARESKGKLPAKVVLIDNKEDTLVHYQRLLKEYGAHQTPANARKGFLE